MPSLQLDDFERLYVAFLRRGGFDQPCLEEDYERAWRGGAKLVPNTPKCPHGLTLLTCSICYLREMK